MIISLLRIIGLANERDAILEILQSVIDLTRGFPGCMGCACYEESQSEGAVLYIEQWETSGDLHRHVKSDLYQRIISAMELSGEIPEMRFLEVSKSMGMELVETLRTNVRTPNSSQECEVS